MPIEIPKDYTASDLEIEHKLAYFREDLGINLHHWHWHLVYPFDGAKEVVDKNRRGELFYYMHEQLMARLVSFQLYFCYDFNTIDLNRKYHNCCSCCRVDSARFLIIYYLL